MREGFMAGRSFSGLDCCPPAEFARSRGLYKTGRKGFSALHRNRPYFVGMRLGRTAVLANLRAEEVRSPNRTELIMDAKDRLLIAYLQRNARLTAAELGPKLGLSRSAVQARIVRLERSGVISGYTVILRHRPPSGTLRAWMLVTIEKDADSAQVMELMHEVPGVGAIYLLTGELDFIAEAVAATPLGIDDVRKEVAALPGVADIRTHLVLRASLPDPGALPGALARFDEELAGEVE